MFYVTPRRTSRDLGAQLETDPDGKKNWSTSKHPEQMWLFSQHNLKVISFVNKHCKKGDETAFDLYAICELKILSAVQGDFVDTCCNLVSNPFAWSTAAQRPSNGNSSHPIVDSLYLFSCTMKWKRIKLQQKTLLSLFEISEKSQHSNEWLMMFSK